MHSDHAPAAPGPGLDGSAPRAIHVGTLGAIVADAPTPPATLDAFDDFEALLQHLETLGPVLAARFGSRLDTDEQITRLLSSQADSLSAQLALAARCAEMTIRWTTTPTTPPATPPITAPAGLFADAHSAHTGTDYLRRRRVSLGLAHGPTATALTALAHTLALAQHTQRDEPTATMPYAGLTALVPREHIAHFQTRFAQAGRDHAALAQAALSGPWRLARPWPSAAAAPISAAAACATA